MYQNQPQFSGNLQALRGLAAFAIIFYHVANMGEGANPGALSVVHQFGAGVTLFFILSGFSLCLSNFERMDRAGWLRGYAIKRAARILPVWWLFIAITIVFRVLFLDGRWHSPDAILFSVVPFFPIVSGFEESLVWAGWTIGVEVMFYLIFPLLLVMLRAHYKAWLLASVVLVLISVRLPTMAGPDAPDSFIRYAFARHAFIFVLGATLYFAARHASATGKARAFSRVMMIMSVTAFIVWGLIAAHVIRIQFEFMLPIQALALGGLTAWAYLQERFNLYNAVTKFLGDKSYTLYLAHPIVIIATRPLYDTISSAVPNITAAFALYCALVIAITCAVAAVISTLIEAPLYNKGRALAHA